MFENPSSGLSNTVQKDRNNVLKLSLNGSVEVSYDIVLSVLPGKNHCLKIGKKNIHLVKGDNDTLFLPHKGDSFAFSSKKISDRYFLTKSNTDENYGLMRFISTSKHPVIIGNSKRCNVVAKNLNLHIDYIFLFRENGVCSLIYTTEGMKVEKNNKKNLQFVREHHSQKIRFTQEKGFQII